MPPSTSTVRVAGPASSATSDALPTATMRPSVDRHRLPHAAGSVDRVDDAVGEDQVGRHQAVGRRGTSTLRRNSQTTSPRWLVPIDSTVTTPRSGLLFDSTTSSTVVCA